ncbi:MAG TPA: hypothetical protein VJ377_01650 [Dehalococcoidales bacterium]|nr:hypothetical protein [Dehalococcoidales bacterium]
MLKVAFSFIFGVMVCVLLLFGVRTVIPTLAGSDNLSGLSENTSLVDLLPDIEKIYRESLTAPFKKAESKIYDPEIAEFYRELMDKTGLATPDGGTN